MDNDIHKAEGPAFIFDPETYFILDANFSFLELYGYSLNELVGMHVIQLRAIEEKQEAIKLMEDTKGNVIYSGDSTHQKKNGEKINVKVFGRRFQKDNKDCYLIKIKVK